MDSTSSDDSEGVPGFDCYWKTVATLDLPSDADFKDYRPYRCTATPCTWP